MKSKVIANRWLPTKGFTAITLFGFVFTREPHLIDRRVMNHELIHARQQKEWLYIGFFMLYGIEWLWHRIKTGDSMKAYWAISFEREAYAYDGELSYLERRRAYANYRKETPKMV